MVGRSALACLSSLGLFFLAGFRPQFVALSSSRLRATSTGLSTPQIAGFDDELGFSTPAVTEDLIGCKVGQGRASAADHRTRSAIRFISRMLTHAKVERSKRAGRTQIAPTEWTKVLALKIGKASTKLVRHGSAVTQRGEFSRVLQNSSPRSRPASVASR